MSTFLDFFGSYDFAARQALILILVGISAYVLLQAGLFAVPQIGLMAIGSYVSALLSLDQQWPFPVVVLCGAAAAGLVGLVLGALLARLNGIYLAIATIGFSEVVRETAINLSITGKAQGLFGIPLAANDLYIVGFLLAALILLGWLATTRFGLAMSGIREEPLMTRHQGVNIRAYRVVLFGLAGVIAGSAGALYVHQSGFIDPSTYSFGLLIQVLAVVVLGGMTNVIGPVLGGCIVFGLPQVLAVFNDYRNLVNGVLIVLVVALFPSGIAGGVTWIWRRTSGQLRSSRARARKSQQKIAVPAAATETMPAAAATPDSARQAAAEPMLRLTGIAKHFGGISALQGISLDVAAWEVFGIIGPNGSGKTSLLNVLSGVYTPDSGDAVLDGGSITGSWGRPERLARAGIARTFQGIRVLRDYSVRDNVMLGFYLRRNQPDGESSSNGRPESSSDGRSARDQVMHTLDELRLTEYADVPAGSLPYGLQRKVEIARALVGRPKLLLLDEPTAGMSPNERSEIFELVHTVQARGVTVIVVEHDVTVMSKYCHRVAVLNFGRTIALGVPESVMQSEEVISAYIGRPA